MYNGTSKIQVSSNGYGILLPRSATVLFPEDLDAKIRKTAGHISYLSKQLSERNTHGGKNFRTHNSSVQGQIADAIKRLGLLQSAKAVCPNRSREEVFKINVHEDKADSKSSQDRGRPKTAPKDTYEKCSIS